MEDLKQRLSEIKQKLNLDQKKGEIVRIQKESEDPDFWTDHVSASNKMQELSTLQKEVEEIEMLELEIEEEMGKETVDEAVQKGIDRRISKLELKTYFSGKFDKNDAIFSIHAGQGGTEAMDWSEMLERMYLRFF